MKYFDSAGETEIPRNNSFWHQSIRPDLQLSSTPRSGLMSIFATPRGASKSLQWGFQRKMDPLRGCLARKLADFGLAKDGTSLERPGMQELDWL